MARKPLIPNPETLLPPETGKDLLERVIERNRGRAGRTAPENEGMKETSLEGSTEGVGLPTSEGSEESSIEEWLEGIFRASKIQTEEGKTTRLNLDIELELHKRLKRYCFDNDITIRRLVAALLTAYLGRMEK